MKGLLLGARGVITCLLYCSVWLGMAQTVIHVSPNGDDVIGDGSRLHPYASLQKAYQKGLHYKGVDTLYIRLAAGRYELSRPVCIDASPSVPVVVEGTLEGNTVLSGAKRITGWKIGPYGWWTAHVDEVERLGWNFEQLYVNGKRATLARTPDQGMLLLDDAKEWNLFEGLHRAASFAVERYTVSPESMKSLRGVGNESVNRIIANFYHKWSLTRRRVAKVVADSGFIFTAGMPWEKWNPIKKHSRVVLENYKNALSMPGEWFLDSDGTIFYIPRPGENLDQLEVDAPTLPQLLIIRGHKDKPVQHLTFRNLIVEHAGYVMPTTGNAPYQAAADISAAIDLTYATNIHFYNCEIRHTGNYAFNFGQHTSDCSLKHSWLWDLGAGGVKIGEYILPRDKEDVVHGILIENNILQHTGLIFPSAVGVVIFHASDNKVLHNELSDMMYTGVSLGWTWGYHDSYAKNNEIGYNHIHHIGKGVLSDMGGVYTLGPSPGTHIHHNVIHDIVSYDYGGWGIYTDEGSSNLLIENNLVYRCKSGGFHQHYGKDNVVRNNIFALGKLQQLQLTKAEPHRSFIFERNIVLGNGETLLYGQWSKAQVMMQHNLYWQLNGDQPKNFGSWISEREISSLWENPCFIDPLRGDFHFMKESPLKKIGFVPFDYNQAGVYGSLAWRQKAKLLPQVQ